MRLLGAVAVACALLLGGGVVLTHVAPTSPTVSPMAAITQPSSHRDRDRVPRFCVVLLRHVAVGRCTWDDHDRDHDVAWKGGW